MRTDTGRSLDFKCPDKVGNPLHAIFKAPALQAVDNLFCGARVPEIRGAHFHGGCAGQHELHHIFSSCDPAHADDWNFHGVRSFVNHAQRNRLDGGAAQAGSYVECAAARFASIAIKPIALRMVYEAAHTVEIPVIGMGGITTAEDVVEFMLAGAAAVEVGTANFWDPCATEKIVDGLQRWCFENRVKRITDLIGTLEVLATFRICFASGSAHVHLPCLLLGTRGLKSRNKHPFIGFKSAGHLR